MFTREILESLPRKELQAKAKEYGVKANGASEKIIASILEIVEKSGAVEEEIEVSTEDIIVSEAEIEGPGESIAVSSEEVAITAEETQPEVAVETMEEVVTSVENAPADTRWEKGDMALALINDSWTEVSIVRVNKKTIRVAPATGKEQTVEVENVKRIAPDTVEEIEAEPEAESEEVVVDFAEENCAVPKVSEEVPVVLYQEDIVTLMDDDFEEDKRGSFLGRTTKTQQLRQAANAKRISDFAKKPERPRSFANTPSKSRPVPVREAIDGDYLRNAISATVTPVAEAPESTTKRRPSPMVQAAVKVQRLSVEKKATEIKKSIENKPNTKAVPNRVPSKLMANKPSVNGVSSSSGTYGKNTFGSGSAEQKASKIVGAKSTLPSSVITSKPYPAPATNDYVFKARKMPNFNKGVFVANKENKVNRQTTTSIIGKSNVSDRKPMTMVNQNKPAFSTSTLITKKPLVSSRASMLPSNTKTVGIMDKNRSQRQSMFTSQSKERRMSNMVTKRFK